MNDLIITERSNIVAVADSIRNKIGSTEELTIGEMIDCIESFGLNDSGIDTSDATATADDILIGKTAYANDEKITGTFSLDAEITTQEEKLSTQDNLIANMMAALEGKAAGNNSSNTKTIYLDWSEDAELIGEIVYLNNQGQFITVEAYDNDSIEAEHGIVFVKNTNTGTWWTDGLKNTVDTSHFILLQATQDGETIYFVSNSSQQ